jgi:hypothetical protein
VLALAEAVAQPFVDGIGEVDESYFGAVPDARQTWPSCWPEDSRHRPARVGKVFVQIMSNCSKTEL